MLKVFSYTCVMICIVTRVNDLHLFDCCLSPPCVHIHTCIISEINLICVIVNLCHVHYSGHVHFQELTHIQRLTATLHPLLFLYSRSSMTPVTLNPHIVPRPPVMDEALMQR